MAIKQAVVLESTGATAEYHVVTQVMIDTLSKTTSATIMSYVSADTHTSGKQPIQGATTIYMQGVPDANEGAISFAEKLLIVSKPTDGDQTAGVLPYGANRYMLAGGTIVE
ncbi:hypothetical protein [Burkholderia cepacia]|uniref:hypothetical protein n=1 Tax=Burkholderia cepacia TaxID=292 RepID=UPI0007562519|nr:hypothetical protein [Burkholderia cepacia]KVQ35778.1 hypothetical protein WK03_35510 [Burkholderia cepacia]NTX17968.1 hypothetical protein [Burkholderia cepacia]